MSHVSSASSSFYPYRGTLSRLDTNGDGVLSREELAADERPGLLQSTTDDYGDGSTAGALGSLMAMLVDVSGSGRSQQAQLQVGSAVTQSEVDIASDVYRGTYGQYDSESIAA